MKDKNKIVNYCKETRKVNSACTNYNSNPYQFEKNEKPVYTLFWNSNDL